MTEPDFRCPECRRWMKGTYYCIDCEADVRDLDDGESP